MWYNLQMYVVSEKLKVINSAKEVGMGRYEKYVHWEVANANPYRFRDFVF